MDEINDSIIRALSYLNIGENYKEVCLINEVMENEDFISSPQISLVLSSFRNTGQIGEYSFSIKGNELEIVYGSVFPAQYTILTLNISDLTKDLYKVRYIVES